MDAALGEIASELDLLSVLKESLGRHLMNPYKKLQSGDGTERPAVARAIREQESPVLR